MVPIEVGNGPDVPDVIKDDMVLALACLWVLWLFLLLHWTLASLKCAEIEADIGGLRADSIFFEEIAGAIFATIFRMLGCARRALQLFVPDGAEVPEKQRVPA